MAFLSLVVLCVDYFALDVVELEPVGVDATTLFNCSKYDGTTNRNNCTASPYCLFLNQKCVDDPCLKYLTDSEDECLTTRVIKVGSVETTVTCSKETLLDDAYVTGTDCAGSAGSGILCRADAVGVNSQKFHDYCPYAFLRDNKVCPVSICREINPSTSEDLTNQCIKNTKVSCSILSTEAECGLVPKCYWASSGVFSGGSCIADPCFVKGANCATYKGATNSLSEGDCVDYKPYSPVTGEVEIYCVHKDNKNPNICYLAGHNTTVSDDYITHTGAGRNPGVYPTYNFWIHNSQAIFYKPDCSTPLAGCEGTGNCQTIYNTKGALAGAYCTDGTHGDDGTSILRIPSLLVFLFVLASMFF